ncbi:uncharacterized protein HaLaN_32617, partial [Haematococcus lacustris]
MAVVEGWWMLDVAKARAVRAVLVQEGLPRRGLPEEGVPGRLHVRREILRPEVGPQEAAAHSLSSAPGLPAAPRLRSRCFINGLPVSLRSLRALSGLLLD